MDARLHFITVATRDLDAARSFYRDGFGWEPAMDVPGEIVFLQVANGLMLGLFDALKFERDNGIPGSASSVSGVVLSHNVESEDDVRALVERLAAAGGVVTKVPQPGEFGGIFHAQLRDPNGVLWEIAHNPGWTIADDGTVVFG